MPTRVLFDAASEPAYPHRVLLVWQTFITERCDFTEAGQWLGLLMGQNERVRWKITTLDEHGLDYLVAIGRSIFFHPYHGQSQSLVRVCSYLLLNDVGTVLHRILNF